VPCLWGGAVTRRGLSTLTAVQPPASEEIALAALEWIDASAVTDGDGVWWSSRPSSAEPDPGLYHGGAGIVLALLEAHAHFGGQRWADLALRGTRGLAAAIDAIDCARDPVALGHPSEREMSR
jgi:hypothetical protein